MTAPEAWPEIQVEVSFLSESDGGRREPPDLRLGGYRPHLVVGDPNIRTEDVRRHEFDGGACRDSRTYLGVQFRVADRQVAALEPTRFQLQLIYHPSVDYGELVRGSTFTVREGTQVVGFGQVLEGPTPSG